MDCKIAAKLFGGTCKNLKQETYHALRHYRRQRTLDSLSLYKEARRAFNAYCNIQKSIHNIQVLEDLVSSHFCSKSFWEMLKNITGSRK